MERRLLLGGLGASAVLPAARAALPVPAGKALAFQVSRNGSPIGEHQVAFSASGDVVSAVTTVTLKVALAGVTLFDYHLRAVERWQGDQFQTLDSVIDYNGDPCTVHAERVAGGYAVQGTNQNNAAKTMARYIAPADTLPATYWNKQMIHGTLLNIQTAHIYKLRVVSPGWNKLPTANGGTITARRYDLSGALNISVWYDQDDAWAGLAFQKSGSITYQKIT